MKLIDFINKFRDSKGMGWDFELWEKFADKARASSEETYFGVMDETEVARGLDDLYAMIKAGLFEDYPTEEPPK
jgi:hypothetical protein